MGKASKTSFLKIKLQQMSKLEMRDQVYGKLLARLGDMCQGVNVNGSGGGVAHLRAFSRVKTI
jgi:hypothetical protein